MERIIITAFTDPMMGLSYESEPIMERLRETYGERIEFRYVMSLLVRDVADFMMPEELALPTEAGIRAYNRRLAEIYKGEEAIGGLPIDMEGFCLFDAEHRSSRPLCLAYKAAQLASPDRADGFLTALRHATVNARPTTRTEIILDVVRACGIDVEAFLRRFRDGSADAALDRDIALTRRLGIRALPSYLIGQGDRGLLMRSFQYRDFVDAIERVSDSTDIKP